MSIEQVAPAPGSACWQMREGSRWSAKETDAVPWRPRPVDVKLAPDTAPKN